jgi:uncharacterized protein YbjT (DUF2867 family)
MRVLVTGATGFVGSRLVPALLDAGHDVRVLTRDADRYEGPATVYEGDVLDRGSFEDALDGVEAAYYLIHSMSAGSDFVERDNQAARNFAQVASEAHVSRVVYLSGLGDDTDCLSTHLRSRREVEIILDDGDYDLTTLRAAIIIGAGSSSFEMIRQLVSRLSVMITPRWVHTECQPIAIDDVLNYLVAVLDVPATANDTFEIGGPESLTYKELLERTARILDCWLLVIPVAKIPLTFSAYCVNLITDVSKNVSQPLVFGMRNRVVVEDTRIEDLTPVERTSFETAVEKALASHEMTEKQRDEWSVWALGLDQSIKPRDQERMK